MSSSLPNTVIQKSKQHRSPRRSSELVPPTAHNIDPDTVVYQDVIEDEERGVFLNATLTHSLYGHPVYRAYVSGTSPGVETRSPLTVYVTWSNAPSTHDVAYVNPAMWDAIYTMDTTGPVGYRVISLDEQPPAFREAFDDLFETACADWFFKG